MSVRNRGRSSNYDRASSGGGFLRQALMFLSLGALSFLLGFFVLAGLMPGHGPETPAAPISSPVAPSTPIERRPAPIHIQPAVPLPAPLRSSSPVTSAQPPSNSALPKDSPTGPSVAPIASGASAAKGPTLDPVEGDLNSGATQPASGLDTPRPELPPAAPAVSAETTSVPVAKHRSHRRRTHKKHPEIPTTQPATGGEQSPAAVDQANPPVTQPPADPGEAPKPEGGAPDKSGSGDGKGGNN